MQPEEAERPISGDQGHPVNLRRSQTQSGRVELIQLAKPRVPSLHSTTYRPIGRKIQQLPDRLRVVNEMCSNN